jgi:hypothetical protein
LKCRNATQQKEWFDSIMNMLETSGRFFHKKNLLRYDSFAPLRTSQMCRWFVNGN